MNKKLILGISIGVSITSILVGSTIFAVESNKYKGYKVVYNNVAYSATQRKNMDIDEYSYSFDDCSFKYEDDYVPFLNVNTVINENNNFKDFMFNVSFDLKNNSGVEGKLYISDLKNNRLASSKGGMVSLSNVKYDFNKNSILNVSVDSLYIDDRQTISFSMTNIRLMIWGR